MSLDTKQVLTSLNATCAVALQSGGGASWQDAKFWLGLLCLFGCLAYRKYGEYAFGVEHIDITKFVYNMGVNLIVLAIVQGSSHNVVVYLCAFVLALEFPNVLKFGFGQTRAMCVRNNVYMDLVSVFTANNVYMDLDRHPCRIVLVFLGQILLTTLYILSLKDSITSIRSGTSNGNYFYWVVAVIAVQSAALYNDSRGSQLGPTWDYKQWRLLVRLCFSGSVFHDHVASGDKVETTRLHCCVRCVADFVINAFVRDLIGYTIPLFLMVAESEMDVVKDALALAFITQLDNLDKREYNLELEIYISSRESVSELSSSDVPQYEYQHPMTAYVPTADGPMADGPFKPTAMSAYA